jgi:hypothetical protein
VTDIVFVPVDVAEWVDLKAELPHMKACLEAGSDLEEIHFGELRVAGDSNTVADDSDSFYNALMTIGVTGMDLLTTWQEYQRLLRLKKEAVIS